MGADPTQEFYESHAAPYEEQTKDLLPKELLERFTKLLPPGGQVLEVGCAYGRDSAFLAEHGFHVTGLDYSKALIRRARMLVPSADFRVGDIRDADLTAEFYDGIWAYMSLFHFPKAEFPGVLARIAASMKTGGILGIGMKIGEGERFITDDRYKGARKYFAFFSKRELEKILTDSGFEIIEAKVHGKILPYQDYPVWEALARKRT